MPFFCLFFRIQSPGNAPFQPHTWLRYIDDIFTAFTSTIKAINTSFLDVILFTQYGQILLKNATRNRQRLFAYLLYSTTLDTNKSKRVPFLTTYNPSLSSPTSPKNTTIYLFLLAVARQLFSIFLSAAFRRSPNLRDLLLVTVKLSDNSTNPNTPLPLGSIFAEEKNCYLSLHFLWMHQLCFLFYGQNIRSINSNMTCLAKKKKSSFRLNSMQPMQPSIFRRN